MLVIAFCFLGTSIAQDSKIMEPNSKQEPLYLNGIPYISEGRQTNSQHQFFKGLGWAEGSLIYEGKKIDDVLMSYNIYEEALLGYNNKPSSLTSKAILLDANKIDGFSIYGSTFIHTRKKENISKNGFVEHYYDGPNIACYVKWEKKSKITDKGTQYFLKNNTVIEVGTTLYKFNGKKTVFEIFPDQKKQIKQFMNINAPKLNANNIEGLEKVLNYCEQFI